MLITKVEGAIKGLTFKKVHMCSVSYQNANQTDGTKMDLLTKNS
jgi:hypothetical protein